LKLVDHDVHRANGFQISEKSCGQRSEAIGATRGYPHLIKTYKAKAFSTAGMYHDWGDFFSLRALSGV
jgi:hypothetical protein